MISLITPTHQPSGLDALARSIQEQGDHGLEWLIVPNNGGIVPKKIAELPFVRVEKAPHSIGAAVGALKKFGFGMARGDVLVELDHDDELLPGCLDAVQSAFSRNGDNTFFYSATYETNHNDEPILYGKEWGWHHDEDGGRKFNVPFPATARSLCEIFYAPNHVRAWSRLAYEKSGGHDPKLEICDDQDLMIRTYLSGATFALDERPLYWQKISKESTQKVRNRNIQIKQAHIRDVYLDKLGLEWSKREGLLALDFGGAHACPEGYTPVDKHPCGGIQCDVTNGLPFEDKSVGIIRAHDFLEHIPIGKVVPLMNEIHRVLAHGGFLLSCTPSTDGRGAFCDPTHVSFWNQLSFRYYTSRQYAAYVPEIQCKFQSVSVQTFFPSDWHRDVNIPYVAASLCADHGGRLPGARLI